LANFADAVCEISNCSRFASFSTEIADTVCEIHHASVPVAVVGLRAAALGKSEQARKFYESEALRGGWSVRQLDRQINSLFYERTALSRNKAKMLTKGAAARHEVRPRRRKKSKARPCSNFSG
jgi:hypothetical protein